MDLNGTYRFTAASPQAVWNTLHDSTALQNAIPGAEKVAWQGDSAIAARVKVGLGPISGTFGVQAQVVEETAPNHMKLAINRQGANNSIQGQMTVDLAADGTGTVLTYQLAATLSGPIAMADNPMTKPLVQKMADQVFANLEKQVG
jgi:carbon monoxide dehydrogenase subunit G